MNKILKIFFWLIIIILILIIVYWIYWSIFSTCCGPIPVPIKNPPTVNSRLTDPNLVYASQSWAGLCSKNGQRGGCYTEMYLYSSGKFEKIIGFTSEKTMEKTETLSTQFISSSQESFIKELLSGPEITIKNCPSNNYVMDAGWDYQINLGGVKKSFRNPPDSCKSVFDRVDKLLDSTGHLE